MIERPRHGIVTVDYQPANIKVFGAALRSPENALELSGDMQEVLSPIECQRVSKYDAASDGLGDCPGAFRRKLGLDKDHPYSILLSVRD